MRQSVTAQPEDSNMKALNDRRPSRRSRCRVLVNDKPDSSYKILRESTRLPIIAYIDLLVQQTSLIFRIQPSTKEIKFFSRFLIYIKSCSPFGSKWVCLILKKILFLIFYDSLLMSLLKASLLKKNAVPYLQYDIVANNIT